MELFGWRKFDNRRQLAGALGLTPMPYQSGDSCREQGISRAGNGRVRAMGDRDCLVVVTLPARQRIKPVVSETIRRGRQTAAADRDCRHGQTADDRSMAFCGRGGGTRGSGDEEIARHS